MLSMRIEDLKKPSCYLVMAGGRSEDVKFPFWKDRECRCKLVKWGIESGLNKADRLSRIHGVVA